MSNIYHLEPQAFGLILFKTTFGDLELELFTKQCPKITKNFVQLCLDGYYNGTIFDRVERDFIAVGGKLTIETTIKETNPDELHSRLKFSRRGLVATANEAKDANGAEFLFTLGAAPELQNRHSIFGRLRGDSIYHLVDLNECPVDEDLVPISEKKILETIVKDNPFPGLEPRSHIVEELKRLRRELLDPYGEEQSTDFLQPKLEIKLSSKKLSFYQDEGDEADEDEDEDDKNKVGKSDAAGVPKTPPEEHHTFKEPSNSDEQSDANGSVQALSEQARQRKLLEVREKFQLIKRQMELDSATKIRTLSERRRSQDCDNSISESNKSSSSKQSTLEDPDLSNQELRLAPKKGRHRERETLGLVESFKKKLKQTIERNTGKQSMGEKTKSSSDALAADTYDHEDSELVQALELVDDSSWLHHRFDAEKDASAKSDDWYSIDDPRNRIVERVQDERAREYSKHRRRDDRHAEDSRHTSRSSSRDSRHRHSGSDSGRSRRK